MSSRLFWRRSVLLRASLMLCLLVVLASILFPHPIYAQKDARVGHGVSPMSVKVLIITMTFRERDNWVKDGSTWILQPPPPGAFVFDADADGVIYCRQVHGVYDGVCLTKTGVDKTNATASMMAVLRDHRFSFQGTYFLTNGTAAVPAYRQSTLGSVALANWVVDWDQGDHLLPLTAPGIPYGYIPPGIFPDGTAVFPLNQDLADKAYAAASQVRFVDSDSARLERQKYPGQSQKAPSLLRCDTVAGDNLWAGTRLSQEAQAIVNTLTRGKGDYCTYEQEDSGVATALSRFGYLSRCYLNMRAGSAFDQPSPGQTVEQFLSVRFRANDIALMNLHQVGSAVIDYLLSQPSCS